MAHRGHRERGGGGHRDREVDDTTNRSARCVFVGNIPYEATEEQLVEVFQQVGPVVSFRLVFDRETGKAKGYGFCEYRDSETALSAMRNLNNYEFNNRNLRVDFAENEKANMQASASGLGTKGAGAGAPVPNVPPPTQPARGPTATIPNNSSAPSNPETINGILENMSPTQIYDFVAKMKAFVTQNPEQGRQLLVASPPLAFMTLQAQALLGMINQQTVQKILSSRTQPPQPVPTPAPSMVPQQVPPVMMPPQMQPGLMPMMPGMMPPGMVPGGFPGFVPPGMPAQPMMPQPTQVPGIPELPEQHKQLLQQIFSMTPESIEKLPPDQKLQVQQLRQTFLPYAQFFAPPM